MFHSAAGIVSGQHCWHLFYLTLSSITKEDFYRPPGIDKTATGTLVFLER